jgi:hypothetical protein
LTTIDHHLRNNITTTVINAIKISANTPRLEILLLILAFDKLSGLERKYFTSINTKKTARAIVAIFE